MIVEYADPVDPQFLEVDLPTATTDGVPINYVGAIVTLAITAWRPDGSHITWSTEDAPPTVEVLLVGATWVARHTYHPDNIDLPFMRDGKGDVAEYAFDADLTVNGVAIQTLSFCKRLRNRRACCP